MDKEILKQIGETYGTPSYVFDLDMLKQRIRMIRECMGEEIRLCYAMKANPFLIRPIEDVIDGYEVCSPGEFRICEQAGIPMEKIVVSGVNKQRSEIDDGMKKYGAKGTYTIESRQHLELLESCAKENGIQIQALIRVTSGNQFGIDEDEVLSMVEKRMEYPHVEIRGLQHYSGTQKKKFSKIKKELEYLDALILKLKESCGYETEELEYGPGLYVPYFQTDEEADDRMVLKELRESLYDMRFRGRITLEMGRYLSAYCGYYLTAIAEKKENYEQKYLIVDGGIHHLTYFGQAMAMKLPHIMHLQSGSREQVQTDTEEMWNVCGSLCTVNDVIVKQLPLRRAKMGDLLVFERTGAYAVTEGMYLFLSRDLPQILFYTQAQGVRVVRKRKGTSEINGLEMEW